MNMATDTSQAQSYSDAGARASYEGFRQDGASGDGQAAPADAAISKAVNEVLYSDVCISLGAQEKAFLMAL